MNEKRGFLKGLFKEAKLKPTAILLVTPFLLTAYIYYGSPGFFNRRLAGFFNPRVLSPMSPDFFNFGAAFVTMFVIPALLIKFFFRERLKNYGLQSGDRRYGLLSVVILYPLISLLLVLPSAKLASFERAYPLFRHMGKISPQFLLYALVFALYYLGFEFFFRGFLLFGLREQLGDFYSLLIQAIPTCLIHIGKPDGEIFASIFSAFLFGYIALRTRSIWYVFLLHWLIGVSLNLFIGLA